MPDTTPNPPDARPADGDSLSSPMGILIGAVLVHLLAITAFAVASLGQDAIDLPEDDGTTRTVITVLLVIIGTILAVTGTALLIVGSIRWAMFGGDGKSAPASTGGLGADAADLLRSINERLLLSETAKRIAYRHEDIETLRNTVREDISKHRFDAALILVAELSQTYGQLEEAENFRDQITAARMAEQETKVTAAIARLDDILARHEFERGLREAEKIQRLFPDSERVRPLVQRVAQSKEAYKHSLEREFLAASERDDVDKAIELLKELDRYLSEAEAEPFRETARGVIGKKRDNLGVQFKIAVHDKEWLRAVRVGEQIIQDFPNTKMSNEVRSMLDLLRERAAGQQAAHSV